MQKLYDKGIYTGFALVIEMIERNDFATQQDLATKLRGIIQNKIEDRLQLVVDHAYAMHQTLSLPKNSAKGHWRDENIHALLRHLECEVSEFKGALWGFFTGQGSFERVESEASDVSNIAAMIVDNCRRVKK